MRTETIKALKRAMQLLHALPLLGALAFTACADNSEKEITPDNPSGNDVTITVTIPHTLTPTTRSIAGEGGEAVVDKIDILVFCPGTTTGSPDVLLQHVKGTNITQSINSLNNYEVKFLASLVTNPSATSLVVLANVPESTINSAKILVSKENILEALSYASTNTISTPDGWKWNTNAAGTSNPVAGTNYTAIPMYGEYAIANGGVKVGMNITGIELIRMLARIDVVNNATTTFILEKIHVVNYNTAGYIAPAWNTDGTMQSSQPSSPMIPSNNSKQTGITNAMVYTYAHNGGSGIRGDIYTYEAAATTGSTGTTDHTSSTCLILEGTYDSSKSYYRVDFTAGEDTNGQKPYLSDGTTINPSFDPSMVKYIPLWRNHSYTVKIMSANGRGYSTASEALNSLGVMNNLKTELLALDDSEITSTVFNGQYYLGIGSGEVKLGPLANSNTNIKCTTNYTAGWVVDGISSSGSGWLSATKTSENTLSLTATSQASNERTATVYLKAGLLQHELNVTQVFGTLIFEGTNRVFTTDGSTYTFTLKSTSKWRVKNVFTDSYIWGSGTLLNTKTTENMYPGNSGGPNNAGEAVTFTTANNLAGQVAYVSVVFESTDDPKKFEDTTIKLLMSGEYYPEKHKGWAGSNIYWNGSNLYFKTVNDKSNQQGVFFQWGSLYGLSAIGSWSGSSAMYPPTGGNFTAASLGFSSWNSWLRVGDTAIESHLPTEYAKNPRDRAYLYESDPNTPYGTRDICKYLTGKNGIPAGEWRMPTSNEFEKYSDYERSTKWMILVTSYAEGTKLIDDAGYVKNNDIGTPSFPAAASRMNLDGSFPTNVDYGRYWSASPSGSNAYCLEFTSSSLDQSSSYARGNATPIRCVKK